MYLGIGVLCLTGGLGDVLDTLVCHCANGESGRSEGGCECGLGDRVASDRAEHLK